MSNISVKGINYPSFQQFEGVKKGAASKREEVLAIPLPTKRELIKETTNFLTLNLSSPAHTIKQTLKEFVKCFTSAFYITKHALLHPRTTLEELRIYNGNYKLFEDLLVRKVPIKEPEFTNLRGGLYLIPFEQFDPNGGHCLVKGDSKLGMEIKENNGTPTIVEHNGKKGKLYWITDKKDGRYKIIQRLLGRLGPVGAPDFEQHEIARSLVDYPKYFYNRSIKSKRNEIAKITLDNALDVEKLLNSGNNVDIRKAWRPSILTTLFKCMVGDISEERMNFIVNKLIEGFQYLLKTKVFSPFPGVTIFSKKNQAGEKALKDLDILGLDMMTENLKKLQGGKEPQDLLDDFTLGAVRLANEGICSPEEAAFEVSKVFYEMIGAGYFNRTNNTSNFNYLVLTDNNFRQELIKTLNQFQSTNLEGMMQEALENENLLKPFEAAACASLAYIPSLLFIGRSSRFVFRELDNKNEEAAELKNYEVKRLINKFNLNHPLLKVEQKKEVIFPLGGYCSEGLKRNGFLLENGELNSKAVFNPANFKKIGEIGRWQFGMGLRGCVGETLSVETLSWEALCMAYLLKKFPNTRIVGEIKTIFNIFNGKDFNVRNIP